jgi:hypothetical protein
LLRRSKLLGALAGLTRAERSNAAEIWTDLSERLDHFNVDSDRALILIQGDWHLYHFPDERFVPSWTLGDSDALAGTLHFQGRFRGTPVFQQFGGDEHIAFAVAVDKHGHFRDCVTNGERVQVFLDEFDELAATAWVDKLESPMTLDGRELERDEALLEIRDRVRLRFEYGTQYLVDDPSAAVAFNYPLTT